jgi:hypothetical protein
VAEAPLMVRSSRRCFVWRSDPQVAFQHDRGCVGCDLSCDKLSSAT